VAKERRKHYAKKRKTPQGGVAKYQNDNRTSDVDARVKELHDDRWREGDKF